MTRRASGGNTAMARCVFFGLLLFSPLTASKKCRFRNFGPEDKQPDRRGSESQVF